MGYGPYQAGEEAERERIAAYLDAQAETHRAEAQAPGTSSALRDRRSNYVVALENVARDIRNGAHLRGEESI